MTEYDVMCRSCFVILHPRLFPSMSCYVFTHVPFVPSIFSYYFSFEVNMEAKKSWVMTDVCIWTGPIKKAHGF